MTSTRYRDWRMLYRAAMLESDEAVVREKIQTAESALRERLESLQSLVGWSERKEVEGALKFLNLLKDNLARGNYDVGL